MELTDIMPLEDWKKLADDIYNLFGFNGTVFDKNNNVFVKSEKWANKICPAIKSGDSRVICSSAQKMSSNKAKEKKEPVIVECDAGLTKFVLPIFVNDEFVGMIGGCGCLSKESEVDSFYLSKLLKKEEEEIKALLPTIQYISKEKLEEALQYFQKQVQDILSTKK